eukprot:scaffold133756_cov56-Cyclotella_meneghiniana.AAC.1
MFSAASSRRGGSLRLFINSADEVRHEGKIKPVLTKLVRLDCGQNPIANATIRPAQSNIAPTRDITATAGGSNPERGGFGKMIDVLVLCLLCLRGMMMGERVNLQVHALDLGSLSSPTAACCYWIHYTINSTYKVQMKAKSSQF